MQEFRDDRNSLNQNTLSLLKDNTSLENPTKKLVLLDFHPKKNQTKTASNDEMQVFIGFRLLNTTNNTCK